MFQYPEIHKKLKIHLWNLVLLQSDQPYADPDRGVVNITFILTYKNAMAEKYETR